MSTWHDGTREHHLDDIDLPAGAVLGWRTERLRERRVTEHTNLRRRPVHLLREPSKSPTAHLPFSRFADDGTTATAECWPHRYPITPKG